MYRGKKKFGKRVYRKKRAMSAGVRALKIAKSLQRKIEWKHYDYDIGSDGIDTTGQTYPLLEGLGQEVGATKRIGDFINLGRLHISGSIMLNSTAPVNVGTQYRVLVLKGINENNQIPLMGAATSLSLGVLDNSGVSQLMYARKYVPNIRDTKIIFDKLYTINPQSNTRKDFRWNFNVKGKTQYILGGANTVENGGLYLMVCTDNNSIAASIRFRARTTFSDQ